MLISTSFVKAAMTAEKDCAASPTASFRAAMRSFSEPSERSICFFVEGGMFAPTASDLFVGLLLLRGGNHRFVESKKFRELGVDSLFIQLALCLLAFRAGFQDVPQTCPACLIEGSTDVPKHFHAGQPVGAQIFGIEVGLAHLIDAESSKETQQQQDQCEGQTEPGSDFELTKCMHEGSPLTMFWMTGFSAPGVR